MSKTVKKVLIIAAIVLGSLIALVLLLYASLWIARAVIYKESMDVREYVCNIPDINGGYTPQGIAYSEERDLYIQTGYEGKDLSALYLIKDGNGTRVRLADEEGNDLKGHAGGVTCAKDYVYIANGGQLHVYSLSALVNAEGEKVKRIKTVAVDNSASFCFSDDTRLFVGEFYRAGNYETAAAHYYTTPDGAENKAIVSCYPLNERGEISSVYPDYSISVTGLVQGFAICGDTVILSRSYGLANSSLEYYGAPIYSGTTVTLTFEKDSSIADKAVPLYYLDGSNLKRTLTLSPFSEDLCIAKGRVVVTTEAACNKYFIGKLFGADKIYSYPIDL